MENRAKGLQWAADRLGISHGLAWRLANNGELPGAIMIGGIKNPETGKRKYGRWIVNPEIVEAFLKGEE
mgnify:CR=1 FL=1|jgi:hypothetical protein